ncbi:MAG: glycosyltransferase family 39 protein [Acidobacteriota bacterium]|nr:glycosyltransferase family 39 protein [Acidobacteriota bacterium]
MVMTTVTRRIRVAAVVLVVAATAAVYATRLSFAPIYLVHDEIKFSLQAISVAHDGRDLNGRFLPVYFSEPAFTAGRDPMMIYATALALLVLPLSEAAVRLPTALVGVLNVLLMLVLARTLFKSDAVALAAAGMLALSPGHFIFSRMALSVLYPLPFVMLWLISLQRFQERADGRVLMAGTAALGLGIYGYLAGLVMMPVYLLLTGLYLAERRSPRWFGWAVAGFAVTLIPLLLWQVAHPERYAELIRAYRVGSDGADQAPGLSTLFSLAGVKLRLAEWWYYFNPEFLFLSGDTSMTNSTRRAGLFPIVFAVLLPIGIYRLSRTGGFERIVLIGFATAPLAAVLTGTMDLNRYRALFALPFGVLVATYGLTTLWSARGRAWRWVAVGLVLAIPFQFWGFYRDYIGPYRDTSSTWYGGNLRAALAEAVRIQPAGPVLLSRRIPYAEDYWRFYAHVWHLPTGAPPVSLDGDTFDPRSAEPGSALIAMPGEPWLPALGRHGWIQVSTITEPTGSPSFVVYRKGGAP